MMRSKEGRKAVTLLRTVLCAVASLSLSEAYAASGCTALYGIDAAATPNIGWVNTDTGVFNSISALNGLTTANALALSPSDGTLYYIDRTTNNLVQFDTVNRTSTVVINSLYTASAVGATFDNTQSKPRLFVMYNDYTIKEVDTVSKSIVSNISINIAGRDSAGASISKTDATNAGTTTTSGDIIAFAGKMYLAIDADRGVASSGQAYYMDFGTIPAVGATSITNVDGTAVRLSLSGAAMAVKSVNGISISPLNNAVYLSYTKTGGGGFGQLNTANGQITDLGTNSNGFTDLSDCAVLPDVPIVSKAFSTTPNSSPTTIRTGQNATLTLTLSSGNPSPSYLLADLTDSLPSGVTVASTPNVSTTCVSSSGGTPVITAAANSGSVTIPTGTRVPQSGSSCTVTLTVTGTTRGQKTNIIPGGSLRTTAGTYGSNATAALLVNDPITGTNVKRQRLYPNGTLGTATVNAKPKDLIEYCITATHPGVGYAPATAATITDTLEAPLSFVTGSATQGYGAGQDLKITRNGGTPSYQAFGTAVQGQKLTVSILPFNSANTTVEVCFIAQVK